MVSHEKHGLKEESINLDELYLIILEVWREIDDEPMINLCDFFLVRVYKCIALYGSLLRY